MKNSNITIIELKGFLEYFDEKDHENVLQIVERFKETNINYSPNEFIYKMIEILLPKANILEAPKGTLKMLEIYAMKNSNRRGWIHLSEEY